MLIPKLSLAIRSFLEKCKFKQLYVPGDPWPNAYHRQKTSWQSLVNDFFLSQKKEDENKLNVN